MEISAKLVKDLRDRTGAGMMECKKALVESNGDIEIAIENMRKAGQAKADKKAFEVRLKSEIRNNRLNIERRKKREKQFSSRLQSIQTNIASENQMYASIQDQRLTQIALLESLEKDLVAQTTLKKKGVLSERAWAQVERSVLSQRARIKDLDAQLKQHRYQISRMEQGIVDARLELDTALLELDTLISVSLQKDPKPMQAEYSSFK